MDSDFRFQFSNLSFIKRPFNHFPQINLWLGQIINIKPFNGSSIFTVDPRPSSLLQPNQKHKKFFIYQHMVAHTKCSQNRTGFQDDQFMLISHRLSKSFETKTTKCDFLVLYKIKSHSIYNMHAPSSNLIRAKTDNIISCRNFKEHR